VLYVGRKALTMPDHYEWQDGAVRYSIIDMHDVDGEPLLASPEPSDNVLVLLR
jgi:hypothetical protein